MIQFSYHIKSDSLVNSIAASNSETVLMDFVRLLLNHLSVESKEVIMNQLKHELNLRSENATLKG